MSGEEVTQAVETSKRVYVALEGGDAGAQASTICVLAKNAKTSRQARDWNESIGMARRDELSLKSDMRVPSRDHLPASNEVENNGFAGGSHASTQPSNQRIDKP